MAPLDLSKRASNQLEVGRRPVVRLRVVLAGPDTISTPSWSVFSLAPIPCTCDTDWTHYAVLVLVSALGMAAQPTLVASSFNENDSTPPAASGRSKPIVTLSFASSVIPP